MNERLPYRDMRKLALLAREKIGQKRLLTETDRLLRKSRGLISGTQQNDDHKDRTVKTVRLSNREFKRKGNGAALTP
jgi:hypothetical protein